MKEVTKCEFSVYALRAQSVAAAAFPAFLAFPAFPISPYLPSGVARRCSQLFFLFSVGQLGLASSLCMYMQRKYGFLFTTLKFSCLIRNFAQI